MAVNSIFHTNNKNSILTERNLYKDLIKEAIQIYGHDVYYVDRTLVARDNVLGEDALSKFTNAQPIEMYVEDSEGFGGDKEIITQFGLENRNEITFVVSKEKFQQLDSQISLEDGTDTTGGSILLEAEVFKYQILLHYQSILSLMKVTTTYLTKMVVVERYYLKRVAMSFISYKILLLQMQIDLKRVI